MAERAETTSAASLFTDASLGELLAVVASESSNHPFVGSTKQKIAWDEIKRRHDRLLAENVLLLDVLKAADNLQAVGLPLNERERTEYHNRRGQLLGRLEQYAEASRGA